MIGATTPPDLIAGKGENVFDFYYHKQGMNNLSSGDVAADSYNRYKEDIALAAEMKVRNLQRA